MRKVAGIVLLLALAAPARAEDTDLKQTVSDLSGQANDKERMDAHGAAKVELSQVRTWLSDATNAIKEEAEAKCRRLFEVSRAQLKLIDELIAQGELDYQLQQLEKSLAQARRNAATTQRKLEERQAKLRVLKLKEKE